MKTSVVLFFVTVITCHVSTRNVKIFCKDFPKLTQHNAEFFSRLKWSDFCFKNGADCTNHIFKRLQFERAPYDNKGVKIKKIQLVYSFTGINRITKKISLGPLQCELHKNIMEPSLC